MSNPTQPKYGTQVEQRLENRLADAIRHAVQDELPAESSKNEQVWETTVMYHGEMYGMDLFIEGLMADSGRTTNFLRSIFSNVSGDFTMEAIKKEQESPPKILLRIHKWKRN